MRNIWKKHGAVLFFVIPGLIYLSFFTILIVFYLLQLSFSEQDALGVASLETFKSVLDNPAFYSAAYWTFWFVVIGTPLQLLAGLFLALIVNQNFAARGFVRSFFLLPLAIPGLVTAVIVSRMLFRYPGGHINDFLTGRLGGIPFLDMPIDWYSSPVMSIGLALTAKIWRDMPISMLILLSGLQSIGKDQYEAARTLGAGVRMRFFYITLPLLVPAISTVLILRSIEMWKEFLFPYIISPSYPVLGVLIEYYYHQENNAHIAAAISILLILFILISTIFLDRSVRWLKKSLVKV